MTSTSSSCPMTCYLSLPSFLKEHYSVDLLSFRRGNSQNICDLLIWGFITFICTFFFMHCILFSRLIRSSISAGVPGDTMVGDAHSVQIWSPDHTGWGHWNCCCPWPCTFRRGHIRKEPQIALSEIKICGEFQVQPWDIETDFRCLLLSVNISYFSSNWSVPQGQNWNNEMSEPPERGRCIIVR